MKHEPADLAGATHNEEARALIVNGCSTHRGPLVWLWGVRRVLAACSPCDARSQRNTAQGKRMSGTLSACGAHLSATMEPWERRPACSARTLSKVR